MAAEHQEPLNPASPALGGEEPARVALFDLEAVAEESGMHPDLVRDLCRAGFLEPARVEEERWWFDDHAVYLLRQVHELRERKGVNLRGIRLILQLLQDIERLEREVRFLRDRLL